MQDTIIRKIMSKTVLNTGDHSTLPPGLGAAGENPNANGQGLGKVPPGLYIAFNDKPDDFFENHYEAEVDDVWKVNFDGTNRGNSEGKGMFGAFAGKSGDDPRGAANAKGNQGGGNPNCDDEGVTDNDASNTEGVINEIYTIVGFTAVGSSCGVIAPENIMIQVSGPAPPPITSLKNGDFFTPDIVGTWTITASAQGQFLQDPREVIVVGADAGADFNVIQLTVGKLDGTGTMENTLSGAATYLWTGPFGLSDDKILDPEFTAPAHDNSPGPPTLNQYTFTLTVTYANVAEPIVDTVVVTVTQS